MNSNNSKDSTPLSDNSSDQLDKMLANIMQGSIAMAFRQLIEPDNKAQSKAPPPLKLHDFGGSDFVRLMEKSRRNRSKAPKSQDPVGQGLAGLANENRPSSPGVGSMVASESNIKQSKQKSSPNNDWKCTQECVFRTDGSEETVYQKFHDGQVIETLHHVLYPDGTVKDIKKPMLPSSPSTTSSLSSIGDDVTSGPFKRLWHLVFD